MPLINEVNVLGPTMNDGHKFGLSESQETTLTTLLRNPVTAEYFIIAVINSNSTMTTAFTIDSSLGVIPICSTYVRKSITSDDCQSPVSGQFHPFPSPRIQIDSLIGWRR
jgi:hypothetical protein